MDVNALVRSALVPSPDAPRDTWALGTVASAPSGGKVLVTVDGDTSPVSMNHCVSLSAGDRVLTLLLGQSRIAVAKIIIG